MVTAVVETSIIVDLLRNHAPAVTWYQTQTQPTLGITPIIWMEVLSGGLNKAERLRSARLLQQFSMAYLTEADLNWAMQAQMQYELSHGVGMMDCLIASVSHRLQIPLYTHNLKHFTPLIGNLAYKPFS
ncbi:MAG: PIN domain-containing protein [Anaerolineae bacterium]|nr:PIN domain-containing protein [Anaerolineae bacterium]